METAKEEGEEKKGRETSVMPDTYIYIYIYSEAMDAFNCYFLRVLLFCFVLFFEQGSENADSLLKG